MLVNIYKITNTINGKIYIGQTTQTVRQRWNAHARDSVSKDVYLYRAMRLYGIESFTVETIDEALTIEEGDRLESKYIEEFRSMNPEFGYNMTSGGQNALHLPENKEKISEASKKWWSDPENKKRASESRKGVLVGERNPMFGRHDLGRPHTEETKQLLSEKRIERFKDPEFKARMSEANLGKHHTEEGKANISKGSTGNHKAGTTQTEETKAKISDSLKRAFAEGRRTKSRGLKKGTKLGPMSESNKAKIALGVIKARKEKFWSSKKKEQEIDSQVPELVDA